MVVGGGGTRLHVVEAGEPRGRPIVFIHGVSQCWLTWSRQLNSDLASRYRLVAVDLRGHGLSDKPLDGYGDSKSWADDLAAVIEALELDHPVLCGWSYGPLVILDYLRHRGDAGVAGLAFVGGVSKLGSDDANSVISPEFLGLVPGFLAADVEESTRSLRSLLLLCLAQEPSPEHLYLMLGYNLSVPPRVRQGLLLRSIDNDDLLPKLSKPVLLVHGGEDAVVRPAVIARHSALLADARVAMMPGAGHAAFWDDAATFNELLGAFRDGL